MAGVPVQARFVSPSGHGAQTGPATGTHVGPARSPGGPPPSHQFGPDTTFTHQFTGAGITTPGLVCDAPALLVPTTCTGFLASSVDGTLLDITIRVPQDGAPLRPLVVFLHGWGGNKSNGAMYDQLITGEGFTFLRMSDRGFGESWGQANLADVNVELEDVRSIIGQVVDDAQLGVDGGRVGVFGVSYGGGMSWLSAAKPAFNSPKGQGIRIRTIIPIIGWTDLLYSLAPNGRPDGAPEVAGAIKLAAINALYAGGHRTVADRPYDNLPYFLTEWNALVAGGEPNLANPAFQRLVDALDGYRSIYWQAAFWQQVEANHGRHSQMPILEIQSMQDALFPLPEALRMYDALRNADPEYPIAEYWGDTGHPPSDNKPGEAAYLNTLIGSWFLEHLAHDSQTIPFPITASITRPAGIGFNLGDLIRGDTDGLATKTVSIAFDDPGTLNFDPASKSNDQMIVEIAPASKFGGSFLLAGQPVLHMHISSQAYREQLHFRLYDGLPNGPIYVVTSGTYVVDTGSTSVAIGDQDVVITGFGNVWQFGDKDTLKLEISNVNSASFEPSKVPSVTTITNLGLDVPVRP